MAVPKRKLSKARRDARRAHWRLPRLNLVPCPQCHQLKPQHVVCPNCGHYHGREAMAVE